MKSNIGTIMRKELFRFFTDRRLVMTAVVLPGLMIYLLYSFMGTAMVGMYTTEDDYEPVIYAVNAPDSISAIADAVGITLNPVSKEDIADTRALVEGKKADLLAVFPADFDAQVAAYTPDMGDAPNIELYYNATSTESSDTYSSFFALLDSYESSLANKFDVNRNISANLATEKDTAGEVFSSMLPLLMMVFLFSGCMAVAPESIAGEKERGSIAALLVTPLSRGELATGKVLSLSIIALLSGASSFLGTMLALPKLLGPAAGALNAIVYGPMDYLMLFLVIASTVLLFVGLISVLSAFAKTVKEASMLVMPLMIVSMLIGVSAMFGAAKTDFYWYFIPLYNSVQCMSGILSFSLTPPCAITAIGTNLVCTIVITLVLRKLFNSEKVMFSR